VIEHDLRPPREPQNITADPASRTANNPNLKLWLLLGGVITALILVLLVLPSMVKDPAPPAPVIVQEQKAVPEKSPQPAAAELLRADAEHALQSFLRTQAQPALHNAEVWAVDTWQLAMNTAAGGDKEFGQGNFTPALKAYQDARTQLQTILENREETLQDRLAGGWQFLHENAVGDASAAFELVLAMQADHQQAQLGLERSDAREQVLEFVSYAQQAEVSNTLQLAVEAYQSALQLDPLYSPAQEALGEIELVLQNRAFQDSMGRALNAIDNGKFTVAEKALMEASRIKPGDPTVKETRQQLVLAHRRANLNSLRKNAEGAIKIEDWASAVETYRRALVIDSKAAFAHNGLTQAQEKQQLHQQLDHYLNDTTRLFSDDPLDNARKLLEANQHAGASEPLLAEKLATLQQAVALAVIPVDLLLLSDKLTQVTVYKLGRLGSFEQKQLSLRPGNYTITGSRQGYRDVLKVVELRPGMSGQTLTIRTEEQF